MTEVKFNLLDEGWILATDLEGNTLTLSLTDVFTRAHELKELSGELPGQDVAILRLLLGVLYAVFMRQDESGASCKPDPNDPDQRVELWARLWALGCFSNRVVESYLESYRDRFWLVHPEKPFWQVSFDKNKLPKDEQGIEIIPAENTLNRLIGDVAESENKKNLFQYRNKSGRKQLDFPQAARWLVYLNAFDVSPLGNPGKNPRKITGYGRPWPTYLGLTWIGGDNLFQTLMLNLVLEYNDEVGDGDAWWEVDPPCRTVGDLERKQINKPDNIVELMTMQYRYLQLKIEGDAVIGFALWSGVKFDVEYVPIEKMTPWRKDKEGKRFPRRHNVSKQMWRDLSAFVSHSGGDNCPGSLIWITKLEDKKYDLPALKTLPMLRINTVGIEYNKESSKVLDVFSDSLAINSGLLSRLNEEWVTRITHLLETTDKLVGLIAILAADIAKAVGASDSSKINSIRNAARTEAYFRLDMPFRNWLAAINPDKEDSTEATLRLEEARAEWITEAKRILRELADEYVENAGVRAFVGRIEGERRITAPCAYVKYLRLVANVLKGKT